MLGSDLNKTTINKLNNVFQFVINNPYSDFYKNKYKNLNIDNISSYNDLQKVPFLNKNDFININVRNRTFVPEKDIIYYSTSSGTSDAKKPTIIPYNSIDHESLSVVFPEKEIKQSNTQKIITLLPSNVLTYKLTTFPQKYTSIMQGDVYKLNISAQLIKEANIQGIATTPTILQLLIKYLNKINFDFKQIKWIYLGSEFCSIQKNNYFKEKFPDSIINFRFGLAEEGNSIGLQCEYLRKQNNPTLFHPAPYLLIETIDDFGNTLAEKETGELIITSLNKKAFPLIRYRNKDMGSITKQSCPCGYKYILKTGGRAPFDFLKFHGIILRTTMVEKSLDNIRQYIEPFFQIHVSEKNINNNIKPQLQLYLQLKQNFQHLIFNNYFKENIIEEISKKLQLSAKHNLHQLVQQDIFLPLEIIFKEKILSIGKKNKNIISHLTE